MLFHPEQIIIHGEAKDKALGDFSALPHNPMMVMVEITRRCDMRCPVCFADAALTEKDLPLEHVKAAIDRVYKEAGTVPLQISGGEPTLHPGLAEIVGYAKSLGFANIELVTNGIRIAKSLRFLEDLARHGLTAVYLQFDGLSKTTYRQIRGQDMSDVRAGAIKNVRRAALCCTLAVAVVPGINDNELGDVVRFAIDNIDTVRAINFQSAARFAGRFSVEREIPGYALPELTKRIEEQAGLPGGGFITEILGHPLCNAMSFVFLVDGELKSLFNFISEDSLRKFLGQDRRKTIGDLFMGKEKFYRRYLLDPRTWKLVFEARGIYGKSPSLSSIMKTKHLLIFAKNFMEADFLDQRRVHQCNYGIATRDGVYSFCAYNNLQRFTHQHTEKK